LESHSQKRQTPRCVLVFRIGQLGDTLISIPAIRAIERRHPLHKRVLLTEHSATRPYVSAWDVLAPLHIFDEVLFYDSSLPAHKLAKQLAGLVLKLRRLAPEYAYNLSPDRTRFQHLRDSLFFKLVVGAKEYVTAPPMNRYALLRGPNRRAPLIRQIPEWQRLAKIVDPDAPAAWAPFPVPKNASERASEALRAFGANPSMRFIGVGPGSKMSAKIWPKERFLALGHELLRSYPDVVLVVFGGATDSALAQWLCDSWNGKALNVAGKLSIYESAALLQRCQLYVGNDTGTMHLAAMAGIPCVALFSSRDYPGIWDPMGQGHAVLRKQIDCEGCMLQECTIRSNECLRRIGLQEVLDEVVLRLQEPRRTT
jgi:ADP-heptose:LPS heptosyltransferase